VTPRAESGALDAGRSPAPAWRMANAAAPGAASGRFVLVALAAVLALSLVAGIANLAGSKPSPADADIRVAVDGDAPVVLCVVDAAGQARCFGRNATVAGAIDAGAGPAICGLADRPLASPCAAGGECRFPQVAASADAFGLVLLEPRPPLFGVPRNRLIDAAVLAPDAAAVPPRLAAGVQSLARCFAPAAEALEVPLSRPACVNGACRLAHSSVTVARAAR